MIYRQTFHLQSCHFNAQATYDAYEEALKFAALKDHHRAFELLRDKVLPDIHGHNFEVIVEIENEWPGDAPYLLDARKLEALVAEWNNTNLSVHRDFKGKRATTEQMAWAMQWKVRQTFNLIGEGISVRIVVRETKDIEAAIA